PPGSFQEDGNLLAHVEAAEVEYESLGEAQFFADPLNLTRRLRAVALVHTQVDGAHPRRRELQKAQGVAPGGIAIDEHEARTPARTSDERAIQSHRVATP